MTSRLRDDEPSFCTVILEYVIGEVNSFTKLCDSIRFHDNTASYALVYETVTFSWMNLT